MTFVHQNRLHDTFPPLNSLSGKTDFVVTAYELKVGYTQNHSLGKRWITVGVVGVQPLAKFDLILNFNR